MGVLLPSKQEMSTATLQGEAVGQLVEPAYQSDYWCIYRGEIELQEGLPALRTKGRIGNWVLDAREGLQGPDLRLPAHGRC